MGDTNNGGPAFPMPLEWRETDYGRDGAVTTGVYDNANDGMSLRDYFAAAALTGIMARGRGDLVHPATCSGIAREAHNLADAMLAERAKGGGR